MAAIAAATTTMSESPPRDQLAAATIADEVPRAKFSDRVLIKSIIRREDGGSGLAGRKARVGGWVKTGRKADKDAFAFLELNDGSCAGNLQVIVDLQVIAEASLADLGQIVATGTCVVVDGHLKLPPSGAKQKIELRADKVLHVGHVDPTKYPLPKTRLTLEFLRDYVHLRPRTNTVCTLLFSSFLLKFYFILLYFTHFFGANCNIR